MAKRRWTLVLVPHGAEPSRIVEVSYGVLRVAASAAAGFLVLVLLAGYATVSHTTDLSRTARLQQENETLAREIGELNGRLSTLADTLTRISQRDARIRVLANLEPIDPQVQAAGIGGPAGATSLGLAGMTGIARRSAEVRIDLSALIRRANLLVLIQGSGRQPGISFGKACRHSVDHADPGLALQRILFDAGSPDSALRPAA